MKSNRAIYLFIFLTPIIILQGLLVCKLYSSGILSEISPFSYRANTFIIFFQAFLSSILVSFLLKNAIQIILENEKSGIKFTNIKNDYKAIKISICYALVSIILIFIATKDGIHDYVAYLKHWEIINKGLDP